jgi:hypothetical protein
LANVFNRQKIKYSKASFSLSMKKGEEKTFILFFPSDLKVEKKKNSSH